MNSTHRFSAEEIEKYKDPFKHNCCTDCEAEKCHGPCEKFMEFFEKYNNFVSELEKLIKKGKLKIDITWVPIRDPYDKYEQWEEKNEEDLSEL